MLLSHSVKVSHYLNVSTLPFPICVEQAQTVRHPVDVLETPRSVDLKSLSNGPH